MSDRCLAIIPARGGSKGIPRKNLRLLAGKPLVAHAIAAARAATAIDRVMVSTDDAEIAAAARRHGAEVMIRPAEISDDTASSESAVLHCLEQLSQRESYVPALVMMIQCTAPLTTAADLDGAVTELEQAGADSCFTAVPFYHFVWQRDEDGAAIGLNHSGRRRARRQDLPLQLLENGAAYVMRTETFLAERDRFCGKVVAHVVAEDRCLEIDTPDDLVQAAALLEAARAGERASLLPRPIDAIVFDFDGVLTDNRVLVFEDGREAVSCDRGDGLGLGLLRERGIPMLILSKERNPVVSRRAEKLGIECIQAADDKPGLLTGWLESRQLSVDRTIFVGNDVSDVSCLELVGCAVCPADAHPSARAASGLVLAHPGGAGAVRELCDMVLSQLDPE